MPEFTGERVIPGLVDQDLFNEHLSRYRFAARFAARLPEGARVLDAGCGSGYGAAVLAQAARVTACDIAADAVRYARANFGGPRLEFVQASCEALPLSDSCCHLVTAFEVIEHLERWPQLLNEARRVLCEPGVLLVSTPNKSYYAESRAAAGPNPFHAHEFELREFEEALRAVFPHVRIWTQNHADAIVFAPAEPSVGILEAAGDTSAEHAHFYLAACSAMPLASQEAFAWLPETSNLLRERERHIARLEGELAEKDVWLQEALTRHSSLQLSHEATLSELKQRNEWADRLNREIAERRAAIAQLQHEAEEKLNWVRALEHRIGEAETEIVRLNGVSTVLEADVAARTDWARRLEEQLAERTLHVQIQREQIDELESHITAFQAHVQEMGEERQRIAQSKWIRLGRRLRVGPVIPVAGEE